ncbi:MAG TPA: ribosomal protein S18-alanine N-acetyltransferase [Candidatus Obscuribacterales bacterium]
MTEADLDQIMLIEPHAFGTHHWSRQSFLNELANPGGHYFVTADELSAKLCGYSGFWLIGEEAHITTLAVHPDLRRRYIGELLLINDIEHAQNVGASWLTLEVRASNYAAQNLYFKYGFKNLGTRRKYYQDNDEDALVLWAENIRSDEFKKNVNTHLQDLQAKFAVSDITLNTGALSQNRQNT